MPASSPNRRRSGGEAPRDLVLRRRGALSHGRPEEADQLAGHGGHGDGHGFAVPDEVPIPAMQPLLRAPGVTDDRGGLARVWSRRAWPSVGR